MAKKTWTDDEIARIVRCVFIFCCSFLFPGVQQSMSNMSQQIANSSDVIPTRNSDSSSVKGNEKPSSYSPDNNPASKKDDDDPKKAKPWFRRACCSCPANKCFFRLQGSNWNEGSKRFIIQAVIIWMFLCLPGNIVTLVLHHKLSQQAGQSDQVQTNLTSFQEERTAFVVVRLTTTYPLLLLLTSYTSTIRRKLNSENTGSSKRPLI